MLTPEEQQRLESLSDLIIKEVPGFLTNSGIKVRDLAWLARRLKEENDHCDKATHLITAHEESSFALAETVERLEQDVKRLESLVKVRNAALKENKIYISNLLEEIASYQLKERSSVEELTKPQSDKVQILDRCPCVGPSHSNTCKYWEMPI